MHRSLPVRLPEAGAQRTDENNLVQPYSVAQSLALDTSALVYFPMSDDSMNTVLANLAYNRV